MYGARIWGERNSVLGLSFGLVIFVPGLNEGSIRRRPFNAASQIPFATVPISRFIPTSYFD